MTAKHKLVWSWPEGQVSIVALHDDGPNNGCGWIGDHLATDERDEVAKYLIDDCGYDGETQLEDWMRENGCDELDDLNGSYYRVSSDGELCSVRTWCSMQNDGWVSASEIIEGAKYYSKPRDIDLGMITDYDYGDPPSVYVTGIESMETSRQCLHLEAETGAEYCSGCGDYIGDCWGETV